MTTMNYIGLDVHKKTISYCVKDVSGRIQQEGKIGSTREVPASAGAADAAEEEPCLRTADGNRRGVQQATAAQGELLPGTALRERRGSSEPTAAVEAQPGGDRALSEDRVRSG